jgi:hypothetical protein
MIRSCAIVLEPMSSRSIVDVFEASMHVDLQHFSRSAKMLCFNAMSSIAACKILEIRNNESSSQTTKSRELQKQAR